MAKEVVEGSWYRAMFPDGVAVELRRESASCWRMYTSAKGGRPVKGLASPHLDNLKRCARDLFGLPVEEWAEVSTKLPAKPKDKPVSERLAFTDDSSDRVSWYSEEGLGDQN